MIRNKTVITFLGLITLSFAMQAAQQSEIKDGDAAARIRAEIRELCSKKGNVEFCEDCTKKRDTISHIICERGLNRSLANICVDYAVDEHTDWRPWLPLLVGKPQAFYCPIQCRVTSSAAFIDNNKIYLAWTHEQGIQVWDVTTGKPSLFFCAENDLFKNSKISRFCIFQGCIALELGSFADESSKSILITKEQQGFSLDKNSIFLCTDGKHIVVPYKDRVELVDFARNHIVRKWLNSVLIDCDSDFILVRSLDQQQKIQYLVYHISDSEKVLWQGLQEPRLFRKGILRLEDDTYQYLGDILCCVKQQNVYESDSTLRFLGLMSMCFINNVNVDESCVRNYFSCLFAPYKSLDARYILYAKDKMYLIDTYMNNEIYIRIANLKQLNQLFDKLDFVDLEQLQLLIKRYNDVMYPLFIQLSSVNNGEIPQISDKDFQFIPQDIAALQALKIACPELFENLIHYFGDCLGKIVLSLMK